MKKIGMVLINFPKNYKKNRKAITSLVAEQIIYINNKYQCIELSIISLETNVKFGDKITEQIDNFKVYRLGTKVRLMPISLSLLLTGTLINKIVLLNEFDLLHLQGFFQPFVIQKPIVPVILTIHGMWHKPLYYREKIKDFLRRKYFEFTFSLFIRNCSLLIHNSEYSYNYFNIYSKVVNQTIVPLSIDMDFFSSSIIDSFGTYNLCYIGNIEHRKGLHFLVLAMEKLTAIFPSIKLIIIGSCIENKIYFNFIKSLMKDKGLKDKIIFKGSLGKQEIIKELDKCDLFVLPSIAENTPAVIAEAMARGKPVIASNVGGIKYMIKNGETGFLFNVGNIQEMVGKIKFLLKDKSLRNDMSRNALSFAENNYRIENVSKQLISIYYSLLKLNRKEFCEK